MKLKSGLYWGLHDSVDRAAGQPGAMMRRFSLEGVGDACDALLLVLQRGQNVAVESEGEGGVRLTALALAGGRHLVASSKVGGRRETQTRNASRCCN